MDPIIAAILGAVADLETLAKTLASIKKVEAMRIASLIRVKLSQLPALGANLVTLSSGDAQSATVGTAVAVPCVVLVKDQFGVALSGVTVTWALSGDGSTNLTDNQSTSNGSGLASCTPTLGTLAGGVVLTATVNGASGSPILFTHTGTAGAASTLELVDGQSQTANISTAVTVDPSVRITDSYGNPKSGVAVSWAIGSGAGSVNDTGGTTTDSSGLATVTSWTLGSTAGTNTLTATSAGLTGSPVTFTAQGQSTAATQVVVISGQTQTGVTAGSAGAALVIEIRDTGSNPVQGFAVTVDLTSYPGPLGGQASWSASDVNGRISVTPTTDTIVGVNIYTVTASGLTGSPITLSVTSVAGAAAAVAFSVQPQSNVTTGVTWTQQPTVKIVDQYGNTCLTNSAAVSLAVIIGNMVMSGTTSGTFSSGVKAFTGLAASSGSGISTVRGTSGAFTIDSNPISVTAQAPHHLTISVEPSNALVGVAISPAIKVRVEASDNTLIAGSTALITATVATGTGTLGGTAAVNAVGGVATFSTLTLSAADNDFSLTFASAGLTSDTSAVFTVSTPSASREPVDVTMVKIAGITVDNLATDLALVTGTSYGDSGFEMLKNTGTITVRDMSGNQSWRNAAAAATIPSPPSGNKALVIAIPSGSVSANDKGRFSVAGYTGSKTIYYRDEFLISSNWFGQADKTTKTVQVFVTGTGAANNGLCNVRGSGLSTLYASLTLQNTGNTPTLNGHHPASPGTTNYTRNVWVTREIIWVAESSVGAADGHQTLYFDGVEVAQLTGIDWSSTAAMGVSFNTVGCLMYFGGTTPTDVPSPQYVCRAGVYISRSTSRAAIP